MDRYFTRIFVLVFGLVGITFLMVAFFAVRSEITFRDGTIAAPGRIVDLAPSDGDKGGTLYKPVFEFADREDKVHRVTGGVASHPPAYRRGEEVAVLYRPENPQDAQLDSFVEAWFLPLIFGGLGSIFATIAGGTLIYNVRMRRRTR